MKADKKAIIITTITTTIQNSLLLRTTALVPGMFQSDAIVFVADCGALVCRHAPP